MKRLALALVFLLCLPSCKYLDTILASDKDKRHNAEYNWDKPFGFCSTFGMRAHPPTWLAKEDWPEFFDTIDSVCEILSQDLECCRNFPFHEITVWCHEHLEWCVPPYGFNGYDSVAGCQFFAGGKPYIVVTWKPMKDAEGNNIAPAEDAPLAVLAHELLHCVFILKGMDDPYDGQDVHDTLFKRPDVMAAVARTKKEASPVYLSSESLRAWREYKYEPWRSSRPAEKPTIWGKAPQGE